MLLLVFVFVHACIVRRR